MSMFSLVERINSIEKPKAKKRDIQQGLTRRRNDVPVDSQKEERERGERKTRA